jgi:hypothetical protein
LRHGLALQWAPKVFRLFASKPFVDEQIGELKWSRGYWRGTLALPSCGIFPLCLAGTRNAPNGVGLELAKELPGRFESLKPSIQRGLFEHYQPYREAMAFGEEMDGERCPEIADEGTVWGFVSPAHVRIDPLGNFITVEIAFTVAWDEDHTLGARFQGWRFVELNGSIVSCKA